MSALLRADCSWFESQVTEEVVPIYKSLIARATCITPNQFEAELFSDMKIDSLANLRKVLRYFHTTYTLPHIIISSLALPRAELEGFDIPSSVEGDKFLVCAGSSWRQGALTAFIIVFPRLDEHYEGVGDVFSSMVRERCICLTDKGLMLPRFLRTGPRTFPS